MTHEIIDLTDSPPPSPPPSMPSPSILNFVAANSAEQVQFGNPLWPNNNPNFNFPYTNQQHTVRSTLMSRKAYESTQVCIHKSIETHTKKVLTTPVVLSRPSRCEEYESSQGATSFQPNMHGDQVATTLEPVLEANTYIFPHGTKHEETWTPRDHELFVMGINKYGRGCWTKIARHFLSNKTPQQVQNYANNFFKNLPSTYLYNLRRKNNNSAYSNISFSNVAGNNNEKNLIFGDTSPYNNAVPNLVNNTNYINYNDEPIRKTLMLFTEKVEPNGFSQDQFQPFAEAKTTNNNDDNNYGEVDLELRLGRGQ